MEIYMVAVAILLALAVADLIFGVSNDAVNFLNSSIGSRVAPRFVIMIIASLGIIAGVMFSSGMMEVARKGIFHPGYFLMPELITIFMAVMLTDILLLDLFNTFGLPTSTTVSIVFELLGAAVAVSLIKIGLAGDSFMTLPKYINSAKALAIISGILLSVVIAFVVGAVVQLVTRLIFTFDYEKRLKRYGALWGGVSLSAIVYFILIKGAKGASFVTPEMLAWIKGHSLLILSVNFVVFALLFQVLMTLTRINILKPIVLIGTFALAMAFAANDLVNFIGVPLAGFNCYTIAGASANPLTMSMEALQKPIQSNTFFLLIAGAVMVVTLWLSRKARTVTRTEVSLGRQEEGVERFEASQLSQILVRMFTQAADSVKRVIPPGLQRSMSRRLDPSQYQSRALEGEAPSFDLLRASVNLITASAVVSFATSLKLPLSTTYVTFMVAMGSSLADQAWGRESAVYRVTGVLTVIGGWFFTALMAFTVSLVFAFAVYHFRVSGVVLLLGLVGFAIWHSFHLHERRESDIQELEVFNLKKVKDSSLAVKTSFEHSGIFLKEIHGHLNTCLESLFKEDLKQLRHTRKQTKKIQGWSNIIVANIFKTLRILQKEDVRNTHRYSQVISALQEITESMRDVILRSYVHISNNHKGLLPVQIRELGQVQACVSELLEHAFGVLLEKRSFDYLKLAEMDRRLRELVEEFDKNQIGRIQAEESKTRLSILFYAVSGNALKISEHTLNLMSVFRETFMVNGWKFDE